MAPDANIASRSINDLETAVTSAFDTLWASSPPSLLASRSRKDGAWDFPPVPENSPRAAEYETVRISGPGALYSYTIIHPGSKTGMAPYALGYVDFQGPVRLFGRLTGSDQPRIGDRYEPVRDEVYGYVFRHVEG